MIACPHCRTIQPAGHLNTGRSAHCPGCRSLLRADLFPAFFASNDQAVAAEDALVHNQAQCFYHPGKRAVAPCAACGRLLCALCRIDMGESVLCMKCLQIGRDKQKIKSMMTRRTLYDSIALNTAFWPMWMIFPTLVTAPAALYFAVRHFRAPGDVLPRSYFKTILALLLAAVQLGGWVVFAAVFWLR